MSLLPKLEAFSATRDQPRASACTSAMQPAPVAGELPPLASLDATRKEAPPVPPGGFRGDDVRVIMQPLALSVRNTAAAAAVHPDTIYAAFATGDLTPRKIGKRTVVMVDELEAWLRNRPTELARRPPKDVLKRLQATEAEFSNRRKTKRLESTRHEADTVRVQTATV